MHGRPGDAEASPCACPVVTNRKTLYGEMHAKPPRRCDRILEVDVRELKVVVRETWQQHEWMRTFLRSRLVCV